MKFTAYVRREVSLEFEIEAESREKAAELALDMHCKFCTDIEELESGQTFCARVYAQGEDTFGQGVSFETAAGRLRDAGPGILAALEAAEGVVAWAIDHGAESEPVLKMIREAMAAA